MATVIICKSYLFDVMNEANAIELYELSDGIIDNSKLATMMIDNDVHTNFKGNEAMSGVIAELGNFINKNIPDDIVDDILELYGSTAYVALQNAVKDILLHYTSTDISFEIRRGGLAIRIN